MNHDKPVLAGLEAAPAANPALLPKPNELPNTGITPLLNATAASASPALPLPASSLTTSPAQMEALAQHMAKAYGQAVRFWRDHSSLSAQEAHDRAAEPASLPYQHKLMATPPDKVSWSALNSLNAANPELVVQVWERVKQAASNELQSGERAARVVTQSDFDNLWRHTQFLALRHELGREWRPRNGIANQRIEATGRQHRFYHGRWGKCFGRERP